MGDKPETVREKILKDMKRTKGVRFNASKRLEEEDGKATKNTAYASVSVIIITLLPVFFSLGHFWESVINITTVGLSVFILAVTLLQSSGAKLVKADQFQRCALEINSLRRELLVSDENSDIAIHSARYDEILSRYNINHDNVDYEKYRLEHPDEFESVAQEDIANSRSDIKDNDLYSNLVSRSILYMTSIIVSFSLISSNDFIVRVFRLFSDYLNHAIFGPS